MLLLGLATEKDEKSDDDNSRGSKLKLDDEQTLNRLRDMFSDSHEHARDQAREMSIKKTLKQLGDKLKKAKHKDKGKGKKDEYDDYGYTEEGYYEAYERDREKERKKHKKDHKKHKYELKFGAIDEPYGRLSFASTSDTKGVRHGKDADPVLTEYLRRESDAPPPISMVPVPPSLLGSKHDSPLHTEARQSSFLSGLKLPGTNPLNPNPFGGGLFHTPSFPSLPTMPLMPTVPVLPTLPPLPTLPILTPKPPPRPKTSIIGDSAGPMSLTNDNVVVVNVLSGNW